VPVSFNRFLEYLRQLALRILEYASHHFIHRISFAARLQRVKFFWSKLSRMLISLAFFPSRGECCIS